MGAANPPTTITVMTGIVANRRWFLRWRSEHWETFERSRGLAEFEDRFVRFGSKMIVVAPDFSGFNSKFAQTYAYGPLAPLEGFKAQRSGWSAAELAFFQRCLAAIRPSNTTSEPAEVAYIDGRFFGEDGSRWTAPFPVIEGALEIISKRSCCDRILPALAAGIGPDEGGLYAPFGGEGIFCLSSV